MRTAKRGRKRWTWVALALCLLACAGAYMGDRMLKGRDHPGLRVFISQWMRNYPASFAVEPVELDLTVKESELEQLTKVVEDARERGVILPEGNEYVDAELSSGEDLFQAKVRIKGKLTDHVQGSKWSFRVVAKKKGGFLGMKRFSLQHPGTRNYLCDWLYHRIMRSEGVIALRYGFIRLKFNDEDLGIYAYEEHFGPELLENNGRLPGPLFRFDPALFWEHRLNEMNKVRFDEPFAAYQAAAVDAFGSSDLEKDGGFRRQFEEAVALMDAFRRGQLKASEVFDADRIARRHAILDLVGGHHSMDWSDVKFYYDPQARRVEPVSYESFSAFPLRTLAGSDKWVGRSDAAQDLHERYFNDEVIFRAYVAHLERISRTTWLDSTFEALAPALDSASATIYREFPYKELDRSIYYKNQVVIRKLLNGPKPFHAFFDGASEDTVTVTVLPLEGLPMEIHGLMLADGKLVPTEGTVIVPCRKPGKIGDPLTLRFPVTSKVSRAGSRLQCSVLGASMKREVEVFPYALRNGLDVAMGTGERVDPRTVPFLHFDDQQRTVTIAPGAWTLERAIELPVGYRFVATAPLKLDLREGAEIISHATLDWRGLEGMPIEVFSTDSTSHGVHVIGAQGTSRLEHVAFRHLTRYKYDQERSGDVSFHRSNAQVVHCSFSGTGATLLDVSVGTIDLQHCRFAGGSDQLELHYAQAKLAHNQHTASADDAISLEGGSAQVKDVSLTGIRGIGVKSVKASGVRLEGLVMDGVGKALEAREGGRMEMVGGSIANVKLIATAQEKEMRYGPVSISLEKVVVSNAARQFECGVGSTIKVDGKPAAIADTSRGT